MMMDIVFHSSDLFSEILYVSIYSIIKNNQETQINFHIVEHGISASNQKKLEDLCNKYNKHIFFYPMPDFAQFGMELKVVRKRWAFDSFSRMYLGTILPKDINRVLYLDCDVICDGSLDELYNMDLGDNIVAGVNDCLSKYYYDFFHLNENHRYHNSGVLLIDLEKYRNEKIEEKVTKFMNDNHGYVFFMEQTVVNVVLKDRFLNLDLKYNYYSMAAALSYRKLKMLRHPYNYYSKEEYEEARKNPVLIHFTSSFLLVNRPWFNKCNHPLKSIFHKYAEEVGFEFWHTHRKSSKVLQQFFIKITPKFILFPIISILYNPIRIYRIKKAGGMIHE